MAGATGKITLWGVEVFVAAAQEGAITATAKRLGTSPATVSQQLTNLEANIGTRLLNRQARPFTLTPAGEIFLRRANAILNEADQARAELGQRNLSRLTRFRLGMIEDFDADVTPRLLSSMAEELQSCQFLLETGASHRLLDLLESRALDMVVAAEMGLSLPGMETHPILEEPFVAALPRGALKPGDAMRQLRRMPFVQYTERHHMGRVISGHLARQNIVLSRRFELDSYHAILSMVAGGAGWTILTPLGWMRAQRFRDAVEVIELPGPPLTRTISLVARREVLGEMPEQIATRLRGLLADLIVAPAVDRFDWLDGRMRVLGPTQM